MNDALQIHHRLSTRSDVLWFWDVFLDFQFVLSMCLLCWRIMMTKSIRFFVPLQFALLVS